MTRLALCWWLALLGTIADRLRGRRMRPAWSFRTEVLLRFLRHDWAGMRGWPIERVRRSLEVRPYGSAALRRVRRAETTLAGMRCASYAPPGAPERAAVLYLHGGGFTTGGIRTHGEMVARLALESGIRTLLPEYRLAPEHPHPAALDDTLAAWRALRAGTAAHDLVVAGESSGGWLTLSLLLALRASNEELPAAAVLVSPLLDPAGRSASWREHDRFDYGDAEQVRGYLRAWAGRLPLEDPALALGEADLRGLPPLLVQTGGAERLRDEDVALAERARAAGVDVTLRLLPDMPHAVPLLQAYLPQGRAALDDAAMYIRTRLAGSRERATLQTLGRSGA